jgi:hypothetical protein
VKRLVVLHPQAVADAAVLIAGCVLFIGSLLASHGLYAFADWCDRRP